MRQLREWFKPGSPLSIARSVVLIVASTVGIVYFFDRLVKQLTTDQTSVVSAATAQDVAKGAVGSLSQPKTKCCCCDCCAGRAEK